VIATALAALAAALVPPDRGDLGAAYLRFERAVALAPKDGEVRRKANESFDALTGDFFAGRFDRALAKLARIEGDLRSEAADSPARGGRLFLASHRIEVEPRLGHAEALRNVRIRAVALDGMAGGSAPTAVLLRQGSRAIEHPAACLASAGCVVAIDAPFEEGAVTVLLRMPGIGDIEVARVFLFGEDPSTLAERLGAQIDRVAAGSDIPASTHASLRARHELAFGAFDRSKSADLLADPVGLARSIESDLAQIARGLRPFAAAGDRWRIVRALGIELAVRQFIPEGDGPFPLVIAFHGAGGDENLFFDGYGGGRLLEVARRQRVAIVCPPTVPFGISPNLLPKFLEELRHDVPFDPARVGLLGHSLGAVTASRLTVLRPESVCGAVCIAGFADLPRKVEAPPRRVYLAELDPLFPLEATRASVDAASRRGEAIELVVVPNEGHTLVVGEVVDQAVEWLVARTPRTTASTPPTQSAPSTSPMNTPVPAPADSDARPSAGPRK